MFVYWDFLFWVPSFRWNQAKSRDPNQVQRPFLMCIGVCSKGLSKLEVLQFMWEMKEAQRDLFSNYGKPMAGSTRLVCSGIQSVHPSLLSQYNLIFLLYKSIQDWKL